MLNASFVISPIRNDWILTKPTPTRSAIISLFAAIETSFASFAAIAVITNYI